jgi:hypothetical protein
MNKQSKDNTINFTLISGAGYPNTFGLLRYQFRNGNKGIRQETEEEYNEYWRKVKDKQRKQTPE